MFRFYTLWKQQKANSCNFIKKETPTKLLSEIFKNTFTTQNLQATAFMFWKISSEMIQEHLAIQCPIIKTWLMIWSGIFSSYNIYQ